MLIDSNDNFSIVDISNVCIDCMLILDGGIKPEEYIQVLFKHIQVTHVVTKSKTNLV